MSTLGETLRTRLMADAAVVALIGARLYPNELPEGSPLPAAVYGIISNVPESSFTGDTSTTLKTARVQIDSYARASTAGGGGYAQAHAVAAAIEAVVGNFKEPDLSANPENDRDLYDNVTQYHRVQQDFIVMY